MHEFVSFNHKILRAFDVAIIASSSAALYGKGVFTTIAVYDAKPFLWEKHWLRLCDNAKKTGIDLSEYNQEAVKNDLFEIININNLNNARARITFYDESPSNVWSFNGRKKTSLLITIADKSDVPEFFRLTISPFRINAASPLTNVKSCNYLEKILALDDAKKRGYNEAVQTNERGEIVSACMANIFWMANGKLFTPSLAIGCLAGTTREFLIEKSSCIQTEVPIETLKNADAIFLTSAGIGVVQVSEFDNRKYDLKFNEITRMISQN